MAGTSFDVPKFGLCHSSEILALAMILVDFEISALCLALVFLRTDGGTDPKIGIKP
jgi:hypothetical protein